MQYRGGCVTVYLKALRSLNRLFCPRGISPDIVHSASERKSGYRPVLIIQNDVGNKYSPTVIGAIITSRNTKAKIPTHYWLDKGQGGLVCDSMVELEQIRTLDKKRLKQFMGTIDQEQMKEIDKKIKISLALG